MPVEKKYLKLGVAGLAVVALVIGLSVGLTQKNKADDRSAASNVKANNNIASEAGDTCRPYAKGGKSGRRERRLAVPGAEDADARREELRGALQRELGTDDAGMDGGMAGAASAGQSMGNQGGDRPNRPNRPNGGGNGGRGNGGRGNGGQGGNPANANADDYDYYYGYYYGYGYYDYDSDYDYGKSGKSGNKSGKSGGDGDVCLPVYDPCDPDATPNPDPCYGKSGKSGSPGCAKSGKSGNKSGKSGGMYDYCPCDPCYGKSGKSGSPQCGKSGKSGNKSGKSGNKSGKSGNKSGKSGGDTCDCMPTLCPTPPDCVCEDLPFAFVNGFCTQKCGVSEDGPYVDQAACCLANFPPGAGTCQVDACVETPEPTYSPTAVQPTYSPTDVPLVPLMTPSPTAGSTPTVSTEATGPPTKPGREGI